MMSSESGNPASAATLNRAENVITDDVKINEVAHWYLNAKSVPRPIAAYLKEKFGITAGQAAKAISKAAELRLVR